MKKTAVVTATMDELLCGNRMQTCVGMVVRRVLSISLMMGVIMALAGNVALGEAGVSLIKNGSFENDGGIDPITVEDVPQYWCDVNIPTDKFGGKVSGDWKTKGDYSLFLYVKKVNTSAGDMAMISQLVYLMDVLGDVNEIIFDIKLSDPLENEWDLEKRSALVLIDDVPVWDSNGLGPSINGDGEYLEQRINIGTYDANLHKLTLAIKINEDIPNPYLPYWSQWDFVKFDAYCGGLGYLWEDLNQDCYVNVPDLEMLVGQWLAEDPNEEYDLYQDGIVDFRDFAILAEYWMCNTDWQNWQDENCFEMELLAGDLNNDGIVNLRDFAILSGDWMKEGKCVRSDIDHSKIVDYDDLYKLTEEWLHISWLSRR